MTSYFNVFQRVNVSTRRGLNDCNFTTDRCLTSEHGMHSNEMALYNITAKDIFALPE